MNPEDVGRILDEIGERIGPAGEYAWTLTVRQVYIEGVVVAVLGVLLLGVTGLCLFLGFRRDSEEDSQITLAIFAIVAVIAGVSMIGMKGLELLNPEYHAMIRLLERVVPGQ